MEKINIKEALKGIFGNVPTNNVNDDVIGNYIVVLRNRNGALIDKQPVIRLFDMVFNYCVTDKSDDLSKKILDIVSGNGESNENESENENDN